MKKRLLALALCLVMMTSLLPLTAAAMEDYWVNSVNIVADGVKESDDGIYRVNVASWDIDGVNNSGENAFNGTIISSPVFRDATFSNSSVLTDPPMENTDYYVNFTILDDSKYFLEGSNFSATLTVPGYKIEKSEEPSFHVGTFHIYFKLTKIEHTWQFKQAGNTLTGKCGSCNIDPVTLTLSASSVTLPESPFNAKLETTGAVKEVLSYGDIEYKYNDSGVWKVVDPKTFTPKPGEYQAGVPVYGFPRDFVYEGGKLNQNNEAYLWVKYTVVDPKVTAQTGDNRPIELMMGSVLVFSALAAAAFILDSKRKYSR